MSKKSSNHNDDRFELKFVNSSDGVNPPITEIQAPAKLSDGFPKNINEVGVFSKFVTLEYIAEVLDEDGEPEEEARRLLAIFTMVYETISEQPEHIEMLRYLEGVAKRDKVKKILEYSGGTIENLAKLIKQMREEDRIGTSADHRNYEDNEPQFGSDSIDLARGRDRPVSSDRKKEILEGIKKALEDYAKTLQ